MANQLGVQWELANPYGIAIDEANDVWHAGHVTDLLELDGGESGLLVATETGGVWTISTNGMTVPLSDGWDKPNVNCLASGRTTRATPTPAPTGSKRTSWSSRTASSTRRTSLNRSPS